MCFLNASSVRIFSDIVITHQGRICGDYQSYYDNNEGLLLTHTTLSTKLHECLTQSDW